MINITTVHKFLILASLFIVDFSLNPSAGALDKTNSNKKELRTHLAKMQHIKGGELTLGHTSFYEVTSSDSTLFTISAPSRVKLNSYYISATEVTNLEWKEFYNDKIKEVGEEEAKSEYYPDTAVWSTDFPYSYNKPMTDNYFRMNVNNDYPVVGISWDQAQTYCRWKSKKVNQLLEDKGIDSQLEFRLPTENEWEYAAVRKYKKEEGIRDKPLYSWNEEKMYANLNRISNIGRVFDINKVELKKYKDDGHLFTSKVATYSPNDSGLFDMGGNVSEWTRDKGYVMFYEDNEVKKLFTDSEVEKEIQMLKQNSKDQHKPVITLKGHEAYISDLMHDKKVLSKGDIKICKGGNWEAGLIYAQCGTKQGINKSVTSSRIGFRIVVSEVPENIAKFFPKKKWKG
jgi:formylglycine-generating enzyme required for sulfatase activity